MTDVTAMGVLVYQMVQQSAAHTQTPRASTSTVEVVEEVATEVVAGGSLEAMVVE